MIRDLYKSCVQMTSLSIQNWIWLNHSTGASDTTKSLLGAHFLAKVATWGCLERPRIP